MIEHIRISGVMIGEQIEANRPITEDQALTIANLIAVDATYGTFGEFPSNYWSSKVSPSISKLAVADTYPRSPERGEFGFHLDIDSSLFDPALGGLQHLLGVLAGDLLTLQLQGIRLKSVKIESVSFPESWQHAIESQFRTDRAHTIQEIRAAFNLHETEPLLAFSVKPRIGLKLDALKEITLGVLKAGFHMVELDTRNLQVDEKTIEALVDLTTRAAAVGKDKRVTRFSPNLSVSPQIARELVTRFKEATPDPAVVKIDGGLDGISTCQEVRLLFRRTKQADTPYITTYPLLRRLMQERVADDTFLNSLVWSGSDIIYPGGAPNLGGTYRHLDHAAVEALSKSINRYISIIDRGFPMPTVAGGIYAGQLQAYYELLGPNVAYFLGGGVALHRDGPIEGAKLCANIVQRAREARDKAGKDKFANVIENNLIESAERSYEVPQGADANTFRYISPQEDLPNEPGLRPWFKR